MCFRWVDKYSCPRWRVGKAPSCCWCDVLSPGHLLGAPALRSLCQALLCFLGGHVWALYAGQHCVVLPLEELLFSSVFLAFFFFVFAFLFFFLTGCYPLHLNPFMCVLGLGDVSSALGLVSGICLVLAWESSSPQHSFSFCLWCCPGRSFQSSHSWYQKALS